MSSSVWWMRPSLLMVYFIIPVYGLIWWRMSSLSVSVTGSPVFYDFTVMLMGMFVLLFLLFGLIAGESISLSSSRKSIDLSQVIENVDETVIMYCGFITVFAYFVWFGPLFLNFEVLLRVLTLDVGVVYYVRANYSTIPGLTTLVQFGVVYCCLFVLKKGQFKKYKRMSFWLFLIIILLTLFRVLAWSERLAFIEILVAMVFAKMMVTDSGRMKRLLLSLVPFFGVLFLLLFFMAFEYGRSWKNYYVNLYDSLFQFSSDRLLEYYLLSVNSSAGLLVQLDWPTYSPSSTFSSIYLLPGVGFLLEFIFGVTNNYGDFLIEFYGTAEFNNFTPIFTVIYELGFFGAVFLTFFWGGFLGCCFRLRNKSLFFSLMYLVSIISIIEVVRIPYVSESRFFFIVLGVLFVCFAPRKISFSFRC